MLICVAAATEVPVGPDAAPGHAQTLHGHRFG